MNALAQTVPNPDRGALGTRLAGGNGTNCPGLMSEPCIEADPTSLGMVLCRVEGADRWRARSARLLSGEDGL